MLIVPRRQPSWLKMVDGALTHATESRHVQYRKAKSTPIRARCCARRRSRRGASPALRVARTSAFPAARLSDLNPSPKPPHRGGDPAKKSASAKAFAVDSRARDGVRGGARRVRLGGKTAPTRSGVTVSGVPLAILSGALINNLTGWPRPGRALQARRRRCIRHGRSCTAAGIVAVGVNWSIVVAAVRAFSVPVGRRRPRSAPDWRSYRGSRASRA